MWENVDEGLVRAYLLDGAGGGTTLTWEGVRAWRPEQGLLWLHVDLDNPTAAGWIRDEAGLEEVGVDALLAGPTRPRSAPMSHCLLVVLRGVNQNPGSEPEDMVAVRLWIEPHRVIASSRRHLMAVDDVSEAIEAGEGPVTPGGVLATIAERLLARMEPVLEELEDEMDDLEELAVAEAPASLGSRLAGTRQRIISLRRHLAPKREAIARLALLKHDLLDADTQSRLHEISDDVTRLVENLDEHRDRGAVVQDQLSGRQAEEVNSRMLVLSIVTAIFLPLGLLTGLLGINVGGMPGAKSSTAFTVVCVLLVVLAAVELWVLRRMKWF